MGILDDYKKKLPKINSSWDTASMGDTVDNQGLKDSWENIVALSRKETPTVNLQGDVSTGEPYINTTTGETETPVQMQDIVSAPKFVISDDQRNQIIDAANNGESFESIYNRIVRKPEEIDPKTVESRNKLATLGDVLASVADIVGALAGGNTVVRTPATQVNNAFIQQQMNRAAQLDNIYRTGMLQAAFKDKALDDATKAAAAERQFNLNLYGLKREGELADKAAEREFKKQQQEAEFKFKGDENRKNRESRERIAALRNANGITIANIRAGGKGAGGGGIDKQDTIIPLSNGNYIQVPKAYTSYTMPQVFFTMKKKLQEKFGDTKVKTTDEQGNIVEKPLYAILNDIEVRMGQGADKASSATAELATLISMYPEMEYILVDELKKLGFNENSRSNSVTKQQENREENQNYSDYNWGQNPNITIVDEDDIF